MKRVVSISLGSSAGNKAAEVEFLGECFSVERIGTDGSLERAVERIRELDGHCDCIGLGGIDRYLVVAGRRYEIPDGRRLALAAKQTPVVDGSGLKDTLERQCLIWLAEQGIVDFRDKRVLLVSGVDRFGMAEQLPALGAKVIYGDLIFALHLPIPIRSPRQLRIIGRFFLPLIRRLPFQNFYPTGEKQEASQPKHSKYVEWAEIIAGDFHFIRRYTLSGLAGKVIITNTITEANLALLRERGVSLLVTTTPEIQGRSFGTNVMEGVLVTLARKRPEDLTSQDYLSLLQRLNWPPRVVRLQEGVH